MKNLILVITIAIFSTLTFAKGEQVITEVFFKGNSITHRYTLIQEEGKDPVFKIIFQENKNKPVTKVIQKDQVEFIKNEATRIIWESNFRKPTDSQGCNVYANLISGDEKTKVCTENKKATGMTYGLLNSMSRIFDIR